MWPRFLSAFGGGSLAAFSAAAAPQTHVGWRSRRDTLRAFLRRPPLWVTLAVCAAILGARRIDVLRQPQFWAEDGPVFFQQAWTMGWRALLEPHAGYFNTLQRLVAGIAVQFHPKWTPSIFIAGAMLLSLYTAARTQSSRLPFSPHVGYALSVVLVPDAFEVLLFLVNTQWILAPALLLLLISADARRWWQHAHDGVAACLLGLTGPFSILFVPLFLWRAWCRRSVASSGVASVVLGCAVLQAWIVSQTPVPKPSVPVAGERLLAVPGLRIGGSLMLGHRVRSDFPLPVGTALGLGVLAAVGALALRAGPARRERVWLALALVVLLVASLHRCRFVLPLLSHPGFGARYFFGPQMIVLWLVVAATSDARPWVARTAVVCLGWMLAINGPRLREQGLIDFPWAEHANALHAGKAVTVPINPAGWTFSVPTRER